MDTLRFGEWLADRRIERALTQEALGASVGVGQSSVGQWEDGSTYPTRKYWVRLADAIGADVEEVQRRIERAAAARDMTIGELLARLIALHDVTRARADAGDDALMAELIALGMQTVER